ncbi:MAG TPA: phosphoribosylglycinamide formyltransferase [candidate division Zixibacteria bacterium]|nr:phosphoribosylglycinamide formyltransferase [candidate division Zixibacteria bacterium]
MNLAVFVSGSGTNLQAIIDAVAEGKLSAKIRLVLSSRADAFALRRAEKHGIPTVYLSSKEFDSREKFVRAMMETLQRHQVDFIALAGYMRRVPPEVVQKFKNRITNIHPALLPAFGGKGMYGIRVHQAVIEYGCKVTGVTVHLVDEEYDHGPIVAQRCVPVLDDDTPETLAARVLEVEHQLYPEVLQLFAEGKVIVEGRRVKIAK